MSEINENELTENEGLAVETEETIGTAETVTGAENVAEEAENATEAAENVAEAAENVADVADVTEKAENTDSTDNGLKTEAVAGESKKTNAVLIGIVIILVALVVIFAVLIISKIRGSEKDTLEDAKTKVENVKKDSKTDAVKDTPDKADEETGTSDDAQNSSQSSVVRNYDIPVTLGNYKGIEVTAQTVSVEEAEIDGEMDALLEDYAYDEEITDRTSRIGDLVDISYIGLRDGVPFDKGSGSRTFTLGSGSFIPGFEDEVVGMSSGETKSFDITFPENYGDTELAGVEVTFQITLNSLSQTKYPELTDEFIAENTDYASIAEYREYIRGYLTDDKQLRADEEAKYDITMKLIEGTEFGGDIEKAIEDATEDYLQYYDYMASSLYGIDGPTFFKYIYGYDEDAYHALLRSQAEYAIKLDNALKAIAHEENLEVTKEEFDKEFSEYFFDYYGYTSEEEVYESVGKNEAEKLINNNILCTKAEELLYSYSVIKK